MKFQIAKGSTSVILTVFIQDSSATTGAGLGSLDQTSSIVGGYVKRNGLGVALAVDQNVTTEGTYEAPSTAAQVRIGTPANMRTGTYELHFHNDLFTTADWVTITLGGATNMAELPIEVQLTTIDLNAAVFPANVTEWASSSVALAVGSNLPKTDASSLAGTVQSALDLKDFADAGYNPATNKVLAVETVDTTTTNTDMVTEPPTTAQIATGVWQDATAGDFTAASSIGKSLYTAGVVPGGTNGLFIAGTNAATTVTTSFTTTFTGNLTGSAASVSGAVGSVAGNVDGSVASVTAGVSLAAGAVTNASLAGNMEIVFETDFVTNYNTTRNAWATNAQDFVGTTASDPFNGKIVGASVTGAVGSVTGAVGSVTGAVGSVTGAVGSVAGNVDGSVGSVTGLTVSTIWTSALTEAYAADGAAFTPAQGFFMIWSAIMEQSYSGTTATFKKLDGSTTSMTGTIDDSANPTSITRAT